MRLRWNVSIARRWFAAAALALLPCGSFAAGNWEVGKGQFATQCAACHNLPDVTGGGKQAFPADELAATIQAKINGGMREDPPPGSTVPFLTTDPCKNNTTCSALLDNISAYLFKPHFPVAVLTALDPPFDAIAVGLTQTHTFRLSNTGDALLDVTTTALSDNTNFLLGAACGDVAAGGVCDFTVTFRPQSVSPPTLSTSLTVSHVTFAGSSMLTLPGDGLTQFTVPLELLFTPATAPLGTRQLTITDNKGDRLKICRVSPTPATFDFASDFSVDAVVLDGSGCFTVGPATITPGVPRSVTPMVRFTSGGVGPRNGAIRVQRVDAGGNPLGSSRDVQLRGNPGPLAMVDRSTLFDLAGDPGVEVDNDNVLDRTVTLFSQGSEKLLFPAGTFAITGALAAEYSIVGGTCPGLLELPAFTGNPAPSCTLIVRFNPTDVGRREPAALSIHIVGTTDNSVALRGFGIRGPRLAVARGATSLASGAAISFGPQTINGLYPTIPVTLRNGGTLGDLEVVLPSVGSVAGFTFIAPPACATLAPAAQCTVELKFEPAAVQVYSSAFVVQTRPSGSAGAFTSFQLTLSGQGVATAVPVLSWTDSAGAPITGVDFTSTIAGSVQTRRVRLYNAGPGGVTLRFANVVGADAPHFVIDSAGCGGGTTLFATTSCEIGVQFAPTSAGPRAASVQFATSAGSPPLTVTPPLLNVDGIGVATNPPPTLELSTSALVLAETRVGSSGLPLEIRLMNTGTRVLNVTALAASSPFNVESKTCGSLPFALQPGSECSVSVNVQPAAEGLASGTLSISTDSSAAPKLVALSASARDSADVSSGGCSIASGATVADPTLWTVVLLALVVLVWRGSKRRSRRAVRERARDRAGE